MKKILFSLFAGILVLGAVSCKKTNHPPHEECVEMTPRCPPACTEEYNPVCGCNSKTYSNPCMAESVGIKKWTLGACEENKGNQ